MPTSNVRISTADGDCDAFVAYPDDGRQHPGVVMYMDVFGLRPVLCQLAEELASHGYYVVAPNVFYRHSAAPVVELPEFIDAESRPLIVQQLIPLLQAYSTDEVLRDADAFVEYLTNCPEVSAGPIGVVGYCMGAVLAMRTAAAHPGRVAAVGGFHPGRLVTDAADSPHLSIPDVRAAVDLRFAEGDIAPETLAVLEQALDAAGVAYSCATYPGAHHGYTMSDTGAFDADARQRHWDDLLALFGRTLSAS
ncbi:dienelactone hydrolase family protein [Jongsikchunia kroppenstedtii]|uniref:dienelactone hydrolase family protein n=1 Tax=Jongsikchunia kroppenstedtii TaxID=1121721 RepID=UPI00037FED6F|nr:dienelactone hydrolase family protein [Jongsikchunia kroppenstedtii]